MRVVIVGRQADRDRLRAELAEYGIEVVAEAPTVAAARSRGAADAIVLAPAGRSRAMETTPSGDDADTAVLDEPLTPREQQVLDLIALGLPNKAIAERLAISDQTVKFHVASIIAKLGATNRTDAVRRALRSGLIAI
ncbi:MAG TPA: response regulator transcription factor [Vicinamibacterales bacterium]|nr:response regulator transcription factor [Vicinamibacterales bacterium]